MRKLSIAAAPFVVLQLVAGMLGAQPPAPASHFASDAKAYWTAERLRNAVALPTPRIDTANASAMGTPVKEHAGVWAKQPLESSPPV